MAVTILLGEATTLLIKLYANLRSTTLIWSVAFIANDRLELVYLGALIDKYLLWHSFLDAGSTPDSAFVVNESFLALFLKR